MKSWILLGALFLAQEAEGLSAFQGEREQAVGELVDGLGELVEWTSGKKLYAERDRTCRMILRFAPDHAEARRALGYRLDREGVWVQDKNHREGRNYKEDLLEEAGERLALVTGPFCEHILELAELHAGEISGEERRDAHDDVLFFDEDNTTIRELRGEVKLEDRWILWETRDARERRSEIRAVVGAAYKEEVELEDVQPDEREQAFGFSYAGAVATPLVRVLATTDKSEAVKVARAIHAAEKLFRLLFGPKGSYPEDFTVFLLSSEREKHHFISTHPGLEEASRARLRSLDGSGIQGTGDFAHWAGDPARRLDAVVRFAYGWLLQSAFAIDWNQGWLYEGLGLYLTRETVGTRLNWFVLPATFRGIDAEQEMRARLLDPETNWMQESLDILQSERRPSYGESLAKTINQLTAEDLLMDYALAAYLVEGRATELPRLLREIGKGTASGEAILTVLGASPAELELRVARWLDERR